MQLKSEQLKLIYMQLAGSGFVKLVIGYNYTSEIASYIIVAVFI